MALQFNPPEWLIREYLNRPRDIDVLAQTVGNISKDVVADREARRKRALEQQELEMKKSDAAMKGREQFYKRGDIASLTPLEQQQLTNPAQGPSEFVPPERVPYQMQQQIALGGAQGPVQPTGAMLPPRKSPLIEHYQSFLESYPQGTEGMTTDTVMVPNEMGGFSEVKVERPKSGRTLMGRMAGQGLDSKRTFQEKQEVYDGNGQPIGYMVFDTRSGTKNFVPYGQTLPPGSTTASPYGTTTPSSTSFPPGANFGPKVKPVVPKEAVEKTAAQDAMLGLVQDVKDTFKPEYVGFLQSKTRKIGQRFDWGAVGLGADPQAADFERAISDLRSRVINERTGAQVGERQEWDRLMQLLPDDAKSDTDFVAKLASFDRAYRNIMEKRASRFGTLGYRNTGSMGTPSISSSVSNQSDLPTINSKSQYDALPPGSEYLDAKGNRRRKK